MRPLTREESLMLGLGTPEVVSHGRQAATSSTILMAVLAAKDRYAPAGTSDGPAA